MMRDLTPEEDAAWVAAIEAEIVAEKQQARDAEILRLLEEEKQCQNSRKRKT
jgi:hypothetical protein